VVARRAARSASRAGQRAGLGRFGLRAAAGHPQCVGLGVSLGLGQRLLAAGQVMLLLVPVLQLGQQQFALAGQLRQTLLVCLQLLRAGLQGLLLLLRGLQLGAHGLPGLGGLVGLVLGAQQAELVHLLAVGQDLRIELAQAGLVIVAPGLRVQQGAARLAGAGQQLRALQAQLVQQGIAAGGGQRAGGGTALALQRVVQVLARVAHVQLLARPLLHPQQARDAPVLGLAGPLAGEGKAEALGQVVFSVHPVQRARANLQAAALLVQKALDELMSLAAQQEVQLDGGGGAGVAPGLQIVHRGGAVALEEGGPDGPHQGALASLIGAGQDVETGGEIRQLEGLAELAQLLDAQAGELQGGRVHGRAPSPAAARGCSCAASRASASCAVRAAAVSAACRLARRNSAITSPR